MISNSLIVKTIKLMFISFTVNKKMIPLQCIALKEIKYGASTLIQFCSTGFPAV